MKPLRILLADDSSFVGTFIGDQLRSNGHTVIYVGSGEEAVKTFRETPPELVLMDIEMPGMGGLEAIRQIRKIRSAVRVPIIVITSHTDEGHLLESFMAGADDFLTKPVQPLLLDIRIQAMMRIVSSQRSMAAMVNNIIEGIIQIDVVGRITAFNAAAEKMFGYSANEVIGENVSMLMPSPFREEHDQYLGNYIATGKPKVMGKGREVVGLRKNGETFPIQLGVSEVETPDERFFVGLIRDLTVENTLRKKLADSRNFLADLIEHSPTVTYVKNLQGRYLLVNRRHEEITGLTREKTLGKLDEDIFPAEAAAAYREFDQQVIQNGRTMEAVEMLNNKHGETHFLSIKFPTRDANGKISGICGISTDITQIKHYEKELERLSQYDELTGLYNRRHFLSLAQHELSRAHRYGGALSVMMLDIDHFKRVNDTHGHKAGDIALTTTGQQIRQILRETDIAGRMGGEEFAILLPETSSEAAIYVAERLRKLIAATVIDIHNGQQLLCTLSIGVATLANNEDTIENLLHNADTALYSAKHAGRNRVVAAV